MTRLLIAGVLFVLPVLAVDNEASRLKDDCGQFKILPCVTTLFTDHPFHIAVGSLAPGNGFAAGPALSFTHHTKPQRIAGPDGDTTTSWRLNMDADAVVSSNRSWRAGAYLKARYAKQPPVVVRPGLASADDNPDLRVKPWLFSAYVQAESLKKLSFYGIGQGSSRSSLAYYGQTETIAGGNALIPVWNAIGLRAFGEANVRVVSIRRNTDDGHPSIEQVFSPPSLLDVGNQRAFGQFGEGLRMNPSFGNRLHLNYAATFQEFAAGNHSAFERLVTDLGHEFSLYGKTTPKPVPDFNGPNTCATLAGNGNCARPVSSRNLEGSIGFRFLLTDSFVSGGNHVPFYFQPTLGGSNINGENFLPSYADYRFRAPNLLLFRESFEHSLGKFPVGFIFFADQGKVSATRDFSNTPFAHSFAAGLTLRAGGFPVLSVLFAWGGKEGTHTLAQVNNSLLGGGARPSLF